MKVRLKLGGSARAVDVGDTEQCTLHQLKENAAAVFQLSETPFTLSLNKKDALGGDDLTLSQLGIVPGDLIFVLCPDITVQSSSGSGTDSVPPTAATSFSSCASLDGDLVEGGTGGPQVPGGQQAEGPVSQTASENSVPDNSLPPLSDNSLDEQVPAGTSLSASLEGGRDTPSPCPLEDPEVNRCLQEPLLCRESTSSSVPVLLRDLYGSAACSSTADALWVVVHTLMLEVGFRPQQDGDLSLGTGWNKRGFYKQEYRHLCVNAEHSCSLIGVPMGQVVIIHGVTSGNPPLKTEPQTLKVTDYVQDNVNQDVCGVYKNLERLSRTVKDLICQCLMSQLSEVCGFPVTVGLLSLSYELKLKVLSYLPSSSLTKVGRVCRDLNVTYRDPCLWRRLYLREFGQNGDNSLNKNWYQLYKDAYQLRKERRRFSRRHQQLLTSVPPWLNPPPGHFPPLVPPHHTGGIIGGDYDLNPDFSSYLPNPLRRNPRETNPFLPQGPRLPGGPTLPRPRFDDPFGPGAGPGPPFMALGGSSSSSRNSRASPFSSFGRHHFM